jgi:hypothetical protein
LIQADDVNVKSACQLAALAPEIMALRARYFEVRVIAVGDQKDR